MNWPAFFSVLIGLPAVMGIAIGLLKLFSAVSDKIFYKYGSTASDIFGYSVLIFIGATITGAIL